MKLTGRTILITGGSSGIGFELCKQLIAQNNTIIITGRDETNLKKTKDTFPKIHTIKSDVSDPAQIKALFTKVTTEFPALDVLINNAGIMKTLNFHDTAIGMDTLTQEIDINLNGPIRMAKTFLPFFKTKTDAAIVFVSSGLAFVPLPTSPVYCATKAAIHSFAQSLRVQLKNTKVKVFELAPPATATELLATMDKEDMKGVSIMKVEDMVRKCIEGMEKDCMEIRPGQANQLKLMSRLAPAFILGQLSKPVDRMLKQKH
jgi:uncharacterized oxidoreductase